MFDNPVMTTPFAVAQVLREFAQKLGVDGTYAEVLAQIHLQQCPILPNWGTFLMSECRCCTKAPSTCAFLNPTERQCSSEESPSQVSSANRASITYGRIHKCPLFAGKRTPLLPPTASQE